MEITLGIDIGGSTTKIVAFESPEKIIDTLLVKATDQITSLYGAIGHLLSKNNLTLNQILKIVLTGVGSSLIDGDIYGIPTYFVDEFKAIAHGGLILSKLDKALVVSMGTGTAFIKATLDSAIHIGGSGVGGGTLLGLSSKLFNEDDIDAIMEIAKDGDLSHVDLQVKDISSADISSLPPNATASNFGKMKSTATNSDIACGLINMILQTVGMLAVFTCKNSDIKNIVITGSLTVLPQAKPLFAQFAQLHGLNFIIPEKAAFATAIGAATLHFKEILG